MMPSSMSASHDRMLKGHMGAGGTADGASHRRPKLLFLSLPDALIIHWSWKYQVKDCFCKH